jgi:tetratricopeptide (TPR) repeat protein
MADTGALKITTGGDLGKYFGLTARHMDAFAALGLQLYQQGRITDAGTVFDGMVALDNQSYFGYAGLGAIALAQEPPDLDGALHNLERAAHLNANDPNVHANLGEALMRQARFDEAAKAFEKSLSLDPHQRYPGARRARAIIAAIDLIAEKVGAIARTSQS